MTEEKVSKVVSFFDEMTKRGMKPPAGKPANSLKIRGNQNVGVVGNGNNLTINVHASRSKAKAQIPLDPGGKHITNEQAGILSNLVKDLIAHGKVPQSVWTNFNRRYSLASYRELPIERFADAEKYLRTLLARLRGPAKDPEEQRKRLLSSIHATKTQRALQDRLQAILDDEFEGIGLSKLSIDDLKAILALMRR